MDESANPRLSLGEYLQKMREKKGLTIKEVADQLRLKLSTIKALEENNYPQIGSLVYVKGYLRSYAKMLGVNIEKGLAQIQDPAEAMPLPTAAQKNIEQNAKKDQGAMNAENIEVSDNSFMKDKLSLFIILIIICMMLGIIYILYNRYEWRAMHQTVETSEASVETPATPPPQITAPPQVSAQAVATPAPMPAVPSTQEGHSPVVVPSPAPASTPSVSSAVVSSSAPTAAPVPATPPVAAEISAPSPSMPTILQEQKETNVSSTQVSTENTYPQDAVPSTHFEPPIMVSTPQSSGNNSDSTLPSTLTTSENIVDNH